MPQTPEALRGKLTGKLFTPADVGYLAARRGLGPTPVDDRFPALVVLPEGPDDIARALDFAQTHGLEVSVRSGGHDILGASTAVSGVVIDLVRMSEVRVDPAKRIARAGAGGRATMLNTAAGVHGLAPVLGTVGNVGLGGLTLGGGIGWLSGSHGATVDNLLGVELVTADGRFLRATARENRDLFWALRGGGGNFGVATTFTYRLQPVTQVLAGVLSFKADVASFLRFMRDFLEAAPDALDLVMLIPVHARQTVILKLCWSGSLEAGERVLASLKSFSAPVVDTVKVQSYATFFNSVPPAPVENQVWRGGEFDGLNDQVIAAISGLVDRGAPEACMIGIMHHMHGALCRAPAGSTPFIRRPGHILYNLATSWNGPARPQEKIAWVKAAGEYLSTVNSAQTYVNYLSSAGSQPVRDAYGPHFEQLIAIKRRYDPHNLFRNNRNIKV